MLKIKVSIASTGFRQTWKTWKTWNCQGNKFLVRESWKCQGNFSESGKKFHHYKKVEDSKNNTFI